MYSQTAISTSRSPAIPFAPCLEQIPTLKDLFNCQPIETLPSGAALFWEGDEAGQIFDLLEGVVRVYRIMSDGRRAIMGFVHPGDVLGVSFQDRYLFTAEAVTEIKVRRFARGRFFAMSQRIAGFTAAALRNPLRRNVGRAGPDAAPWPQDCGGTGRQLPAHDSSQES